MHPTRATPGPRPRGGPGPGRGWTGPDGSRFWRLVAGSRELGRREITQCRMNSFAVVDVVEESAELPASVREVAVLGKSDFLFFDGAHQPFDVPVLLRTADLGHAEDHPSFAQALDVGGGSVLDALIGVMDFRRAAAQRALERSQGEALIERTSKLPAANLAREDVQEHSQVDEAGAETD